MSCCCKNVKSLGCIASCGDIIKTGLSAAVSGVFTFLFDSGTQNFNVNKTFSSGDPINLGIDLRGGEVYTFVIRDPAGEKVVDGDFDCFSVQTNFDWYFS